MWRNVAYLLGTSLGQVQKKGGAQECQRKFTKAPDKGCEELPELRALISGGYKAFGATTVVAECEDANEKAPPVIAGLFNFLVPER